jgi:hypothetical protein
MSSEELSASDIHEIFRKIASGERKHGDFLTSFALTFMWADFENVKLLEPAARELVTKYFLASYANEPPEQGGIRELIG